MLERTDTSIRQAFELFTNATKLDSSYARAYVGLGQCYAELGVRSYVSKDEASLGMRSNAQRALEIDQNLAEGHSLLSHAAWGVDDFLTAELEARKAIELNPNLSIAYQNLANLMLTLGYPKKAIELMEIGLLLDPLSPWLIRSLGQMLYYTGREEEALDLWRLNLKVAPFDVHLGLATYYFGKADYQNAEGEVRAMELLSSGDYNTSFMRGYLTALEGNVEGAKKIVDTLEHDFKGGATLERNIGYIKYFLGDMDGFFEAMFHCVETRVIDPLTLRYAPLFEKARKDPRYSEVIKKVGLDPDLKE